MYSKGICMYKNMSETILLEQRSCFMQAKRKTLILVKRHIKFTRVFTLCHKSLWKPSTKTLVFLCFSFLMQPSLKVQKQKKNIKHDTQTVEIYLFLHTQCSSNCFNHIDKAQRKENEIDRNIETLLALHQQLTLHMYTCLWQVLRRRKIFFHVHFNNIINSRLFKTVNNNG